MPTNPDIQPPHNLGLWMKLRLWTTQPNTNIERPK
jgi:hypothetical protein